MRIQFDPDLQIPVPPAILRQMLRKLYQHFCPPLELEDCFALLAKHLAVQFPRPVSPACKSLPVRNLVFQDDAALLALVCADPDLAVQARYLAGPLISISVDARLHFPTETFHAWNLDVFQPAIEAYQIPPDMKPRAIALADLETRQGMLAFQQREIFKHSKLEFSREDMYARVRTELANNLGEPDNEEEFPEKIMSAYIRMIAAMRAGDEPAFGILPDGRLTADKPTIRNEIRAALGQGVGRKKGKGVGRKKTLELSKPLRLKKVSGRASRPLTLADTVAARQPSPSDCVQFRELRDIHDGLMDHVLVQQVIDAVLDRADTTVAEELLVRAAPLAVLLRAQQDRATQAALVFEWSRAGQARVHGLWKRSTVAQAYGVTARRVEKAGGLARQLLGYIRAA